MIQCYDLNQKIKIINMPVQTHINATNVQVLSQSYDRT